MQPINPVIELIQKIKSLYFSEDTITKISGMNRIKEGLIWSAILLLVGAIIFYFAGIGIISGLLYMMIISFLMLNISKICIGISMIMTA